MNAVKDEHQVGPATDELPQTGASNLSSVIGGLMMVFAGLVTRRK